MRMSQLSEGVMFMDKNIVPLENISCLILGMSAKKEDIHVVMSDEGNSSRIITAYFPSAEKWEPDLKTRKV